MTPDAEPLATGRDADVYPLDAHRVLRRYRDGGDVADEVAVMAYVAGLGFPVPRVHHAAGPDLVMERLYGPTMLAALADGRLGAPQGATILADLHVRLHALPPRPGTPPGSRVVHLDLHPDNVVLSDRGPVLIDWRNATDGPPELDLALSALILAEVAVDPGHEMAERARVLLDAFLGAVAGDACRMLGEAVSIRRGNVTLTPVEKHRLDTAAALVRGAGDPPAPVSRRGG